MSIITEKLCFINKLMSHGANRGITEGELSVNRKHVWFFAYSLRMERGTVLILVLVKEAGLKR